MEVETINHQQVDNLIKFGTLDNPEDKKKEEEAPAADAEDRASSEENKETTQDAPASVEISPWGNAIPDNKEKE